MLDMSYMQEFEMFQVGIYKNMLPACNKQRICSHQATTAIYNHNCEPRGNSGWRQMGCLPAALPQSLQPAPKDAP